MQEGSRLMMSTLWYVLFPRDSAELDTDCQVAQFGCTKAEAEEALTAEKGDLVKALIRMVQPRPRARSVDGGGEVKR